MAACAMAEPTGTSHYSPYPRVTNIREGLEWPKGQAIPTFATPAETLDTIVVNDLSQDEQITFSALQGRINRKKPRILLADRRADEGTFTWADTCGFTSRKLYDASTRYQLLSKYAGELDGVVLYDPAKSPHYRNLAGTAASQNNAIPVTAQVHEEMKKAGIDLKVISDFTTFKFTTPYEIYQYLLARYWPTAEKRVIVSAKPHDENGGGDYHHTRDIASATGAAVVWLDTRIPEERNLLRKFFAGMTAGEGIVLGWYATERTGITTASEFGISTMPADFYVSGSVYAGTDHTLRIPPVPKKPALENKIYVAVFISDGDNLQYMQHAMRKHWDRSGDSRGRMALNWTIAPGLADMGPALLNHYYSTATAEDCFVTGPSGMGYLMPTNTLNEPGAPMGDSLKDPEKMDGYARLTETYLQRCGLRVVTIWDDASSTLRKAYAEKCRNLYGATVQNFRDDPSVAGTVENNRVRFDRLTIPYAGSSAHLNGSLKDQIDKWDGKAPLFLSYQVDVWGELRVNRLIEIRDRLTREHPGKIEFVRADHYFNLFNEASHLPHNLALSANTIASTSFPSADSALLLDGTPSTLWSAAKEGEQWQTFDLGSEYQLNRCVIRHAGDSGMDPALNTRDFTLQTSLDGRTWTTSARIRNNADNVSDLEFTAVDARHVKILIENPGRDSIARIADVEIYGVKHPREDHRGVTRE